MSLHLAAPAATLLADVATARRLVSVVESHGGHVVLLGSSHSTKSVLPPADTEDSPSSGAAWEALLSRRGWSPDETVFLAADLASARIAAAARLKVGVLDRTPGLDNSSGAHRWDETWRDLEALIQWFERHGQLARRAWPIATVGGLVFAPDDTALFVRTAKWSGTWGVPGGKIDYGEASVAAFLREIREETGLEAIEPELVLVQDAIEEPEFFRPRHFLLLNYRARCASKEIRLNHESLEAGWFSLEQAQELPLNRPTRHLVQALRNGARPIAPRG